MRVLTNRTAVLAALLALGAPARPQSNDGHGCANSSQCAAAPKTAKSGRLQEDGPSQGSLNGARRPTVDSGPHLFDWVPYSGAVSVHQLAIPGKARKAYNKGVQSFNSTKWTDSVSNFQRAIKLFPAFYEAYNVIGEAELVMRNWDNSEAAFRKSIELSSGTFARPHFGLGLILCQRKQCADAEATILEGIQLDPTDARGHFCLAWVQYSLGRVSDAEGSAREAIRYAPSYPLSYLLLAAIHHQQRDFRAEIEDLNAYLKVDPNGLRMASVRASLADAERSSAKENTGASTNP